MMRWFDSGANLTNGKLVHQLEDYIAAALQAGVEQIVVIGTDVQHSREALALCDRYPDYLLATVGVHPHDAATAPHDYIAQLRELAQHPAARAIGECGLDFNRNYSPPDIQLKVFRAQLELAAELQMPVYLHERDAHEPQVELLGEFQDRIPRFLAHCFTGDEKALASYLNLGCYIGITGWVCDERRGRDLQHSVLHIPADKIVIETDAPFLLPRTLRPRPAYNASEYLPHIGEFVAQLRQQEVSEFAAQSWLNSQNFFQK
ncbi:hydrolase TatD [Pseudidiomarina aestuarii]|uniref:Hydrolase TatD n=1 Tax=Pseudidiomarina aestuarii TaxID=624146 RepID=A0A7Z6ZSH3_9GAMM|nr:TatD family hydrolase [Pseudidiomarina aestuarii]RUO39515.1 hydrolase TatD [Pseudidiomarina aestuarii]